MSSDHNPLIISLNTNLALPNIATSHVVDWNIYSKTVDDLPPPFGTLNSTEDIEHAAKTLSDSVQNSLNSSKFHRAPINHYDLPKVIKDKIKNRNQVRRNWQHTRCPALRSQMNKLTAEIRRDINAFKNRKWGDYIESLAPSDNSLWKYLKRVRRPFTPIPPLATPDGLACKDEDKTEALADQYENQFKPNLNFCPMTVDRVFSVLEDFTSTSVQESIEPTTPEEIISIIQLLPNRKSPGYDGVNNLALKNLPVTYATLLCNLINSILKLCYFPNCWKLAIIVPIFKPGSDPSLPSNYRPISLLSVFGKLVEKVIYSRLDFFLQTNNVIIPEQFGFRPKLSTTLQLLRVVEHIKDGFANKEQSGAVFLDIAKAYDSVWHSGLIFKLIKLKVPKALVFLIRSYLDNRKFAVRYGQHCSTIRDVSAGVPQGSKLGPQLFNLYINDIPKHPHTLLALYADDTAIISRHHNVKYMLRYLQQHLDRLEPWFQKWRIKINTSKSDAVYFSFKRSDPPPINIFGDPAPFQREVKYLGVFLDKKLSFSRHIGYALQKFHKARNDLAHLLYSDEMCTENKVLLYKTVLRPILLYASPVWGAAADTHIQKIQRAQNQVLRTICKAPWYRRNYAIHKDLKINSIRVVVKKLSQNLFQNLSTNPNEIVFSLPDYDPGDHPHRPRAVAFIPEGIHYKD